MTFELPQPLIDDIADGKCLPFVGAGFSLNADSDEGISIPDWAELARQLGDLAGVSAELDGPDAATAYERQFGRVHLIDAVRRALNPEHIRPSRTHQALARLPFDTIYTTNFDLLLEDALQVINRPYRSLVGELQLPFHAGLFAANVVKMHGDIRHEEHFIITREDYDTFLETYPVIATHLSAMLIVRTPLFLGYSRTDSDFRQIQSVIESRLGRFQRMPYIIQFDTSQEEIEEGLDQNIHILNISTNTGTVSRAEVLADFLEAIQRGIDTKAGKQLRSSDLQAFRVVTPSKLDQIYQSQDAADLLESSSSLCFVMMPLTREMDSVYWNMIKPATEEVGLTAVRADEIYSTGVITEQILAAIRESRVCIADITTPNANVLYEVGRAQAIGKPVLLIRQPHGQTPFDIAQMRHIIYDTGPENLRKGADLIAHALRELLGPDKLNEARTLLGNGMYRAAVAIMGVILEHTLQNVIRRLDIPVRKNTRFSSMQMANMLKRQGAIDVRAFDYVRQFTSIRNKAVHQLEEPTSGEAELAFGLLNQIIQILQAV